MAKNKKKTRTSKYEKKLGTRPGSIIYTGNKETQKLFIETFDFTLETLQENQFQNVEDLFQYKYSKSITWA
mgnify:CR=1 FL=1